MNKLSKIFLVIIIILVIALIFGIRDCIQNFKIKQYSKQEDYFMEKAVKEAGFEFKKQDDGSVILAEIKE